MSKECQKTVGVMGGFGPETTADFFSKLIAETPAQSDQDHLHILVDNNPGVPNRHLAIRGEAPSVGPDLAIMARRLETAGADFLVMVCNTAHAWTDEIRASVSIPFVSFIEEVCDHVARSHEPCPVGIMAADGCLEAGLYQDALASRGFEPVCWDENARQRFMTLVFRIKAGERDAAMSAEMAALAETLARRGARLIISGCTEIPLVLDAADVSIALISSTDLLVLRTLAYARGEAPLPSTS
jgi:aspartate racemase